MEVTVADVARALAYGLGAPAALGMGFLYLNDRNRHMAYFMFANAILNLAWLVSLSLVANGYSDREWRVIVTPVIVANSLILCGALAVRLKRKLKNQQVYPCPPNGERAR